MAPVTNGRLLFAAIPVAGNNMKRDLFLAEGLEKEAPAEKIHKEDVKKTQLVPIGSGTGVGEAMGFSLPAILVTQIKGKHYWTNTIDKLVSGEQFAKE